MKIRKSTWHAKWFRFVQDGVFTDGRYVDGTNVCHYMRVTMIWGPLAVGLVALIATCMAVGLVGGVTVLPFEIAEAFGVSGWWGVAALWLGVPASWLTLYGAGIALGGFAPLVGKVFAEDSFINVTWQHAMGVKQKVCPLIRFK